MKTTKHSQKYAQQFKANKAVQDAQLRATKAQADLQRVQVALKRSYERADSLQVEAAELYEKWQHALGCKNELQAVLDDTRRAQDHYQDKVSELEDMLYDFEEALSETQRTLCAKLDEVDHLKGCLWGVIFFAVAGWGLAAPYMIQQVAA